MHELTHIDLFSGIGGFALAAKWAGFRTLCFSEIESYPSAVLKKRWPDVPNLGDISKADFTPYTGATLLTGGFPCQPFSFAGKRRGKEDDRDLWHEMLRVIQQTGPTWVIGENVAGFIEMELDRTIVDMEALGYEIQPLVIPALAVGARHQRKRVWIVAHINSPGLSKPREYREATNPTKRGQVEPAVACFPRSEAYSDLLQDVYGLSRRMDRIKCLGNAIVPQVAFEIIRAIATIET